MLVHFDSGVEKYRPWALRKADQLARLARDLGLEQMAKSFAPEPGCLIFIKARTNGNHFIRGTGGAKGRNWTLILGQPGGDQVDVPHRWFMVGGPKVLQYAEADYNPVGGGPNNGSGMQWSLDGRTLAWIATFTGNLNVARRRLTPQTISFSLLDSRSAGGVDYVRTNRRSAEDYQERDGVDRVYEGGANGLWVSQNGLRVFLAKEFTGGPNTPATFSLYRMAEEPVDATATQFDEVMADTMPTDLPTGTHRCYPMYDLFNDGPLLAVHSRYISTPGTVVGDIGSGPEIFPNDLYSDRVALYKLNLDTLQWTLVYAKVFADTYWNRGTALTAMPPHVEVDGQLDAPSLGPQILLAPFYVVTTLGQEPALWWIKTFVAREAPTPIGGTNPTYTTGNLVDSGLGCPVYRNGELMCTVAADGIDDMPLLLSAAGQNAMIWRRADLDTDPDPDRTLLWLYGGEQVDVDLPLPIAEPNGLYDSSDYRLSPRGDELWLQSDSTREGDDTISYWYQGAKKRSYDIDLAANPGAAHVDPSPDGFHGIHHLKYWSYKNPRRLRALVLVQATNVAGFASFEDLVNFVAAGLGVTYDVALAFLAGVGVNEGNWESFFPPSYTWTEADVELEYQPDSDRFEIKRTFSTVQFPLPSRGPLEEYTPDVTTVQAAASYQNGTIPEIVLVPDDFLPQKFS